MYDNDSVESNYLPKNDYSQANTVMTRQVRAVAAVTFFVTGLASFLMYLGAHFLALSFAAFQSVVFFIAIIRPLNHPYKPIAKFISRSFPLGEAEHLLPLRFAAQIGLTFLISSLLSSLFSLEIATFLLVICSLAAALNAFANICLACLFYPRVQLLRSKISKITR